MKKASKKTRRDHRTRFTPEKRKVFLDALIETANVSKSAKAAGISRRRVYEIRDKEPEFEAAWEEAHNIGIDNLEEEARRRAYEGCDKPVFYKGEECGAIREYSDTLMIFLLKAARPEKYRERVDVKHDGTIHHDFTSRLEKAKQRSKEIALARSSGKAQS